MDFTVPAYHRVIVKDGENIKKYQDLAREQKKFTLILTTVENLETVPKNMEKGGKIEVTGKGT